MPTQMNRYDVLLSCPSDIQQHMYIIEGIIVYVNRIFEPRGFYFCLKNWSRDVLIGTGTPQDEINLQIVNDTDAIIALFGAKLGTPTLNNESGTIEEITVCAEKHKQVFVLFSKNVDANTNTKELKKVQDFKKKYKGIYKEFESEPDLESKIREQLILYGNKLTQTVALYNERNEKYMTNNPRIENIIVAQNSIFISGTGMSFIHYNRNELIKINKNVKIIFAISNYDNEHILWYMKYFFGKNEEHRQKSKALFNETIETLKDSGHKVEIIYIDVFVPTAYVAVDYKENEENKHSFISAKHYLINGIGESTEYFNLLVKPKDDIYQKYRNQILLIENNKGKLAERFSNLKKQ